MILYHPTLENVNVDSPEELIDRYKAAGWLEERPDYSRDASQANSEPAPAKKAAKKTAKKSSTRKK